MNSAVYYAVAHMTCVARHVQEKFDINQRNPDPLVMIGID